MKERNRNLLVTALSCLLVIVCFTFLRIDTSPEREREKSEEKPKHVKDINLKSDMPHNNL